MPIARSYTAGRFQFNLDTPSGQHSSGYVKSVDGGFYKGEVTTEQAGPDFTKFKHITTVEVQPFSVEMGMAVSKPCFDWIADSWNRVYSRRNGSIIHADFNGYGKVIQEFQEALITETVFPALDASSSEPSYLTVKFLPETIHQTFGDFGQVLGKITGKEKYWAQADFELVIEGVNCKHVKKVDSFTVKQNFKKMHYGSQRLPEIEPTGLEFPNLSLELPLAHAREFADWYETYVVKGQHDTKAEKQGALTFLNRMGEELMTVELMNIGISSFQIPKSTANEDKIKICKVELYVEAMSLSYGFGLE